MLVVYQRGLPDVAAWPVLQSELARAAAGPPEGHKLIVYDNSQEPLCSAAASVPGCLYRHDPTNGGTATAYTFATAVAARTGVEWLLLLDHDTPLPHDFFRAVAAAIDAPTSANIAAFVPRVVHGEEPVSPAAITPAGSIRPILKPARAASNVRLTAVASGSVFRVSLLNSLLPLPPGLWLDFVDHWIFARLGERGRSVEILDITLQHDLSISRPALLSRRRLLSVLEGEARFVESLGWRARWTYPLRLIRRLARYLFIRPRLAVWMGRWLVARIIPAIR